MLEMTGCNNGRTQHSEIATQDLKSSLEVARTGLGLEQSANAACGVRAVVDVSSQNIFLIT
jgi:hypothetical protein